MISTYLLFRCYFPLRKNFRQMLAPFDNKCLCPDLLKLAHWFYRSHENETFTDGQTGGRTDTSCQESSSKLSS